MKKLTKKAYTAIFASVVISSVAAVSGASAASTIVTNQKLFELSTVAGKGQMSELNGDVLSATFRAPESLLVRKDGTILVADTLSHLIRSVAGNNVTTSSGVTLEKSENGLPVGGLLDGTPTLSLFNAPTGLVEDAAGNVYVADSENDVIRKIDKQGNVTTIAGSGSSGSADGAAAEATFNHPRDIAIATDGTIYVADTLNHVIRKVDPAGNVTTLTGASDRIVEIFPGDVDGAGDYKDGKINEAKFNEPSGIAIDAKGNLYVSDSGNQRIRYIDLKAGTVQTVAGSAKAADGKSIYEATDAYAAGGFMDGAATTAALLNLPLGLAVTEEGGLLIADSLNHAIRYLFEGNVITLVGNADSENGTQDGVAAFGSLQHPSDLSVAANGDIYIADSYNNKIRLLKAYKLPAGVTKQAAIQVVYGQQPIVFDAKPETVNYRTMVPVRAVTEAMKYTVTYGADNTIKLEKDGTIITFTFGSKQVSIVHSDKSVETRTLDAAPYKKEDRTYVPVRFFAETINLDVQWDKQNQVVILRDKLL